MIYDPTSLIAFTLRYLINCFPDCLVILTLHRMYVSCYILTALRTYISVMEEFIVLPSCLIMKILKFKALSDAQRTSCSAQ